jgi:glycosyltransferase involved in cell wall biosynthesis
VIAETLDSIVCQLQDEVEVVIVDGASPDSTGTVVNPYVRDYANVRYFCEDTNSGVDQDYDKAVGYAQGEYCWLLPDDDLLRPGAVTRILDAIDENPNLIVVEQEVRTVDFLQILERSRTGLSKDRRYGVGDAERLFADMGSHLTFIGAVILRRKVWLARDREPYYGSLFIHVGVIFQSPPIENALFIAEPQLTIRYGNANWTSRTFEIWMFMWPELVHSFTHFSAESRRIVADPAPWRHVMTLLKHRAKGRYSRKEYGLFLRRRGNSLQRMLCYLIALIPASLANFVAVAYVLTLNRNARLGLYDLLDSKTAAAPTRWLASLARLSRTEGMYSGPGNP